MAVDLIAFSQAMDRCWLEQRFDELADYLAPNVVMVAADGKARLEGRDAAIASYRDFMQRSRVRRFRSFGHEATEWGYVAVIEYRWQMSWESGETVRDDEGMEILVLSRRDREWRVIWRMQLAGGDRMRRGRRQSHIESAERKRRREYPRSAISVP